MTIMAESVNRKTQLQVHYTPLLLMTEIRESQQIEMEIRVYVNITTMGY